jgi:hypothetical protein
MMLADAPRYDFDSGKGEGKKKHLSDEDWLGDWAG